ncbi:glycosyltransferase family 2 protein [Clostridium beijerinckii]|uniref:glycosyltransferase family 2 protein n=1 Tax=Clostridium beijerinckii TaxID=1520 RepID=UPI001361D94E|nr:glycosyltransferase family 2 protein [Clostridium beijerinckii]MZK52788.1 glycosyltransferase [Clostridium beijerinckii]MZK60889.1 glycosyltransferase [Clostridium beijerinckii]MZK71095.1 glycosyltransferase [Clostridium beijerinckii]MZK76453.1 glycosyltransferase [Clostridium beijerinckii]MZK85946.1 glycosyltransferase [Clostridium beijerinckii]
MSNKKLSFVIPCYGSEKTIISVIEEIVNTVQHNNPYEIICVNDCSPDGVDSVLKDLAENNKNIKILNLAKNFGQHNALMAGYRHVTGDIIISLDDDGQTPAKDCYKLINALDDNTDVIYAKYPEKKHSLFKNFGSKMATWMGRVLIEVPANLYLSSYFVCKRYVIDEIVKYENPYSYLCGLIVRTTKKIANVDIEHRARKVGTTGYTFSKLISLWLNGFTAFSVKPLRIATIIGLICSVFGFAYGTWIVIEKLFTNSTAPMGYSSTMAAILFIGGMIMLMLGLIGEYIGRIYISINNSPQYVIRERINCNQQNKEEKVDE